jgi:hypothetical protein
MPEDSTPSAWLDLGKERRDMKGWMKVFLVLGLVALLVSTVLGCGGGSGPEDTVRNAFKAMAAMDAEKMATYFVEDVREDVELGMEFAFAMLDKIKITNLKTTVASQTDDEATVEFEFDLETTAFDETEEEHVEDSIDLVKENGKWLISELPAY